MAKGVMNRAPIFYVILKPHTNLNWVDAVLRNHPTAFDPSPDTLARIYHQLQVCVRACLWDAGEGGGGGGGGWRAGDAGPAGLLGFGFCKEVCGPRHVSPAWPSAQRSSISSGRVDVVLPNVGVCAAHRPGAEADRRNSITKCLRISLLRFE